MVLDEIKHKLVVSVGTVGGGRDGKVSAISTSTNNPSPTTDKDGIDTLSMVVSMVGMTCSGVASRYGS